MNIRSSAIGIGVLALALLASAAPAAASEPPTQALTVDASGGYASPTPTAERGQSYTAPARAQVQTTLDRESYTAALQPRISLPVAGASVSSTFGYRVCESGPCTAFHEGVDYAAPVGASVHPVARGTVLSAAYDGNYGNKVVISHDINGERFTSVYAHLHFLTVRAGQFVERTDELGGVGNTGRSYGAHLHFEIRPNGARAVDPLRWMDARAVEPFPG